MERYHIKIIEIGHSLAKEVKCLIRKLVRIGIIIPGSNTFLKLLRHTIYTASTGIVYFDKIYIHDLKL